MKNKSSTFVAYTLILSGLAMFANAGFSMLSYRRIAAASAEEGIKAPLDVQIELGVALFLSLCGAISMYSDFENLSLIHSYKRKTPEQVYQGRKSFRNVMQTRGSVISKAAKIPSLEDMLEKNSNLQKLAVA